MPPPKSNVTISDDWYVRNGVAPPTHIPHMTEEEIETKFEEVRNKAQHIWKQRGPVLYCINCPYDHATEPLFLNHLLQGTDKYGKPILTKLG